MRNRFGGNKTSPSSLQSFDDLRIAKNGVGHQPQELYVTNGAISAEEDTATRRLCAGAYLDREFRQRLLSDIYNCRRRRVAPSYGYDLVHLLQHAWRAWWIELARDFLAVAVFAIALLTAPLGALLMVGLFAVWYAGRACWRVLTEWIRMLRKGKKTYDYVRALRFRAKLGTRGLFGSAITVIGIVIATYLLQRRMLYHDVIQTGLLFALLALLFVTVGIFQQCQLDLLHNTSTVKGGVRSPRLCAIRAQQHHPVTVYSGHRPFIGSGQEVFRWSFAQRIIHKKDVEQSGNGSFPSSKPPFNTSGLIEHLKESIELLAATEHAETRLPGLTVRDHVFIDGIYVNKIPGVLLDPPSPSVLNDIMENPREEARYHIACQVNAWGGEVVTTVFVHISLQGQTLYVEFTAYALLPTPARFRVIDEVGGTGLRAALRMAWRSLSGMRDILYIPRRLLAAPKYLMKAVWVQQNIKVRIPERRDIGARISAREIAESGDIRSADKNVSALHWDINESSYFQLFDVVRHSKIVERCLLAGIEEFLKEKDVDTSEFAQRAQAILNLVDLRGSQGTQVGGSNVQWNMFGLSSPSPGGSATPSANENLPPAT